MPPDEVYDQLAQLSKVKIIFKANSCIMLLFSYLALCAATAQAVVVPRAASYHGGTTKVVKTGKKPTGYEVEFHFQPNSTLHPQFVVLGGFFLYTNSREASNTKMKEILPWDWQPEDFSLRTVPDYFDTYGVQIPSKHGDYSKGFNMTYDSKSGDWVITLPFPSGTFNYAYYPDCWQGWGNSNCTVLTDPSNPPIERLKGDQKLSTIQVPFDGKFQVQNYDKYLPLEPASHRGTISFHTYPSPGSTYPSNGTHQVGVYLPREYGTVKNKEYPVLYLSHGGGGADSDWFSQGRAHNILDRLIDEGYLEPTVAITPNFYNLGFDTTDFPDQYSFLNAVRENFFEYLVPWVDEHYSVYTDRSHQAFGGLSLGGGLALTMLFNATDRWGEVYVMSNIAAPALGDPQYDNPLLNETKIWTGAGFYDKTLPFAKDFQDAMTYAGITGYKSEFYM